MEDTSGTLQYPDVEKNLLLLVFSISLMCCRCFRRLKWFPFLNCFSDFDVIKVVAKDLDEENSYNSDLRYSILSQDPKLPSDNLFVINPVTGVIRVNAGGLDREVRTRHTGTSLCAAGTAVSN